MIRRHFRAPLSFEGNKFNRAYVAPKKIKIPVRVTLTVLKILYIFLLLAIDLVLFAGSGNLNIFPNGMFPATELMSLFGGILGLSIILMLVSVFSEKIQNIICALVTFIFIMLLFNQFAQFDKQSFLGFALGRYVGNLVPSFLFYYSHILVSLLIALAVFWFFNKNNLFFTAVYVLLFLIAFMGILHHNCCETKQENDFIEVYHQPSDNNKKQEKKFIYLMLPNLASYKYLELEGSDEALRTQKLVTGFFAKNNFEVFSNAYNINSTPFMNMTRLLNTFDADTPENHIMDTMILQKYWKFFNVNDEYVFLKDNHMFDTFRKAGYDLSAYKSRAFNLCEKNHTINVNRCIEKVNQPINLYSMDMDTCERTQLLFIEWISSMKIFKNLSWLYNMLKVFSTPEDIPLIGVNYNNLYVINSVKTFDVLADNIIADKGSQAYFVFADIPSDMFIYDEFCKIKPRNEWISINNLPWVTMDKGSEKRKAYFEQTNCLYGKLQEFMDKLRRHKKLNKSVIVIHGVSGINKFGEPILEDYVDDMLYDKLTTLAVKSPENKSLDINERICDTNNLVRHSLYKDKTCSDLDKVNIHQSIKDQLIMQLQDLHITKEEAINNIGTFDDWYKQWKKNNVLSEAATN